MHNDVGDIGRIIKLEVPGVLLAYFIGKFHAEIPKIISWGLQNFKFSGEHVAPEPLEKVFRLGVPIKRLFGVAFGRAWRIYHGMAGM